MPRWVSKSFRSRLPRHRGVVFLRHVLTSMPAAPTRARAHPSFSLIHAAAAAHLAPLLFRCCYCQFLLARAFVFFAPLPSPSSPPPRSLLPPSAFLLLLRVVAAAARGAKSIGGVQRMKNGRHEQEDRRHAHASVRWLQRECSRGRVGMGFLRSPSVIDLNSAALEAPIHVINPPSRRRPL